MRRTQGWGDFHINTVTDVNRSSLLDHELLLLSVCLVLFISWSPLLHSALQLQLPVYCPSFPRTTFTSKLEHPEPWLCLMHCFSYTSGFLLCAYLLIMFRSLKGSSVVPLQEPGWYQLVLMQSVWFILEGRLIRHFRKLFLIFSRTLIHFQDSQLYMSKLCVLYTLCIL